MSLSAKLCSIAFFWILACSGYRTCCALAFHSGGRVLHIVLRDQRNFDVDVRDRFLETNKHTTQFGFVKGQSRRK